MSFQEVPKKNWCIDVEMFGEEGKDFEILIDRDTQMLVPKKNIDR